MKTVCLLLSIVLFQSAVLAQRISLQPTTLDFSVGPAGNQTQTISVANLSDKKVAFQVYLADWLRDSMGTHQYFKADTLRRSCASWIRLNRNFFELEPRQSTEVIVQMQAPTDSLATSEMKWAMLFLQGVEEQDSASRFTQTLQTQIRELLRIGIHVYQTPLNLNRKSAKTISFREVADTEKNTYELKMRNTGNVMIRCRSYLELTDVATGKTYKTAPIEYPVFPEGVRKVRFTLDKEIPQGTYSALAILDLGEDVPLEAMERVIKVK
jgi:hypothetical protein